MHLVLRGRALALVVGSAAAGALLVPGIAAGSARPSSTGIPAVVPATDPAVPERTHVATLTGNQEVPVADPDGTGAATITIDPAGNVCWNLSVKNIGLPATAAHIHQGAVGVSGPPVVTLTPPDNTGRSKGCVGGVDPAVASAILTTPANYYVNVHNAEFTNGAIRGQLQTGVNTAGALHMLAEPLRAYDSRLNNGTKMVPNEVRTVDLSMGRNAAGTMVTAVPPGATAAMVTVTVTETSVAGFLTAYSAALPNRPATSNINWFAENSHVASNLVVAVDQNGMIKLSGVGVTHVVVDVVGFYYQAPAPTAPA